MRFHVRFSLENTTEKQLNYGREIRSALAYRPLRPLEPARRVQQDLREPDGERREAGSAAIGDKGCDADWFRADLADRKITPCITSKSNRKAPIPHDTTLYRQRHKIEIMFGRL